MRYRPTILYSRPIADLERLLGDAIDRGCGQRPSSGPIELFFRADDIGVPSHLFRRLIALFHHYRLPLCLAVVPSWLTARRLADLRAMTGTDDQLWCWHQHGRLHRNFETSGKKQEFGPARSKAELMAELARGRNRLQSLLGKSFSPFFTPPWNRCSLETAQALRELGFLAISRSAGARPDLSHLLPDLQVNVDLHTRKEPNIDESLGNLLAELERSLSSGRCGIMLHHQRMNDHAFDLLRLLMANLTRRSQVLPCRFEDLL